MEESHKVVGIAEASQVGNFRDRVRRFRKKLLCVCKARPLMPGT
jgi:hypothetical protein